MSSIRPLTSKSPLVGADNFPIYDSENGDDRKASLTTLLAWIETNFADPDFPALISAPTASGFNIQLDPVTTSLFIIINPTGAFAAGTVTLPPVADGFDGQEMIFVTTQAITAFTLAGNGATLVGMPTTLAATASFRIRYNALQTTWYCIGQNALSTFPNLTLLGPVLDVNGNELLGVTATASAVNELTLANAATGNNPSLTATGGDANIGVNLVPKGTGKVQAAGVEVVTLSGTQTLTNKTLTAPVLTTPTLGAATATTINLVTITQPAASATLTIANTKTFTASNSITIAGTDGKTLTVSNSITLAGTDATVMTFPTTSATIARTDAANTFTGNQTFSGAIIGAVQSLSGAGAVNLTQPITAFTSTAAGNALTLADGTNGQYKTIVYVAEAAGADTGILTPTNLGGGTTITFNAVGDACELVFLSAPTANWWPVSLKGAVLA